MAVLYNASGEGMMVRLKRWLVEALFPRPRCPDCGRRVRRFKRLSNQKYRQCPSGFWIIIDQPLGSFWAYMHDYTIKRKGEVRGRTD